MTEVNEEAGKLIEKVLDIIEKQYSDCEIKITGIHIEKIFGTREYVVTVNFETSKHTKDGTIMTEQKVIFLKDRVIYTEPYKYIK